MPTDLSGLISTWTTTRREKRPSSEAVVAITTGRKSYEDAHGATPGGLP